MTSFVINPELDIKKDFLNLLVGFTPSEKKIFNYLRGFARFKKIIEPSQDYIAYKTGYCKRTVGRALKFFHERGWIIKLNRSYKTNKHVFNYALIDSDPYDKKNYENDYESYEEKNLKKRSLSEENVHINVHIDNIDSINTGIPKTGTTNDKVDFENELSEEKKQRINFNLKYVPLTWRQRWRLQSTFGDQLIEKACSDLRWYDTIKNNITGKRNIVKNLFAYLYSRAASHKIKRSNN